MNVLVYVVAGLALALLVLIIIFTLALIFGRGDDAQQPKPAPVVPAKTGGFFADQTGNANIIVTGAKLDGRGSQPIYGQNGEGPSRNSLPSRSYLDELNDDEYTNL